MQDKNPFEDFINGRYGEAAAEQLKHIVKTFSAGDVSIERQPSTDPADATIDFTVKRAIYVDTAALRRWQASIDPEIRERINQALKDAIKRSADQMMSQAYGVPFETGEQARSLTIEDIRRAQVECYIAKYGLARVTEAETFARDAGIELFEALRLFELRDALNRSAEALREIGEAAARFMQSPAVQDALNAFGASISQAIADGIEQRPEPSNRHERRAVKHNKPMKDGDQQWKQRRRYRDHR